MTDGNIWSVITNLYVQMTVSILRLTSAELRFVLPVLHLFCTITVVQTLKYFKCIY